MKNSDKEKVRRINCLTNELDAVYHKAALLLNVSDSVLCVMYMLYDLGDGCRLQDICVGSGISKQTINSAIRKLEGEGILYLVHDSGKKKRVFLTDKGQDYLSVTAKKLYKAESDAFADWSDEDFEAYLRLTKKYTESLTQQIKKLENKTETTEEK